MGKWIMLSVVGVLCLSVWTFVAVSFFSAQETIYPEQTTNEMESVNEDPSKSWDSIELYEEDNENVAKSNNDIKTRGIEPGDFANIAPDGVISIDDLLSIIIEDGSP